MIVKYLILSDGGPEHLDDLHSLQKSWAQKLDMGQVFYLKGGNTHNSLDEFGNLNVATSIESILEKTKLGIGFLLSEYSFDYLIRVNVSTFVRPNLVDGYLRKCFPMVAGFPMKIENEWTRKVGLNFFLSGAFLVFDRKRCELFTQIDSDAFRDVPDDVAISTYLHNCGVKMNRIPRNSLSDSHILWKKTHSRLKTSSLPQAANSRYEIVEKYESSKNWLKRCRLLIFFYKNEWDLFKQNKDSFRVWLKRMLVIFGGLSSYWSYRARIFLGSSRRPS